MERFVGRITAVRLRQLFDGREVIMHADHVVNASGACVGKTAALAGAWVPVVYSKGSLLVTRERVTRHVINRLRPPSDADIIVPGGSVSVIGTTSMRVIDFGDIVATPPEVEVLIKEASRMVPAVAGIPVLGTFAGVRPLIFGDDLLRDRSLSRSFVVVDHEQDGLRNFVTVFGGKLTTYRLMAERTADLVCTRLGVNTPCLTRHLPIPSSDGSQRIKFGPERRHWYFRSKS
jgi:glycerol-3-phosphate dehydrogenase